MQQLNAPGVRWEWISEAWNMFTRQWSVWVLMILVMSIIGLAVYLPFFGAFRVMMPTPEMGEPFVIPVGIFALYPIMYLAIFVVSSWLLGGLYNAAFTQFLREALPTRDMFSTGP